MDGGEFARDGLRCRSHTRNLRCGRITRYLIEKSTANNDIGSDQDLGKEIEEDEEDTQSSRTGTLCSENSMLCARNRLTPSSGSRIRFRRLGYRTYCRDLARRLYHSRKILRRHHTRIQEKSRTPYARSNIQD